MCILRIVFPSLYYNTSFFPSTTLATIQCRVGIFILRVAIYVFISFGLTRVLNIICLSKDLIEVMNIRNNRYSTLSCKIFGTCLIQYFAFANILGRVRIALLFILFVAAVAVSNQNITHEASK